VARMGEKSVQGFDGKARRKEPFGRPKRRREDGIRIDLSETGWGSAEWISLAHDRDRFRTVVNTVIDLRVSVPWN
jgi:hypothetical protein